MIVSSFKPNMTQGQSQCGGAFVGINTLHIWRIISNEQRLGAIDVDHVTQAGSSNHFEHKLIVNYVVFK
jgi:hypothetical protein